MGEVDEHGTVLVESDYERAGFTIHDTLDDIINHERQCYDASSIEDASGEHARYSRRRRTVDSCTLPCERGLPKSNAAGEQLVAYQEQHGAHLVGGYNPLALVSGNA